MASRGAMLETDTVKGSHKLDERLDAEVWWKDRLGRISQLTEVWCNGSTTVSGTVSPGSNPGASTVNTKNYFMEIKKHSNVRQKETFEATCYKCDCPKCNKPWWKKLFRKLFLLAFAALAAVQICSCTHTLEDTDGIVTRVEYQKTEEYTYAVVIKYLDRFGPNNQVNFLTNTLYHVGDTIRLGRPCCKHVTNETDTLK